MSDIDTAFYDTKAAVEATAVPSGYSVLRIANYASTWKGGGAFYLKRSPNTQPSHAGYIRDSSGQYWELDTSHGFRPMEFGARGDGTFTDDATTAINNCVAAATSIAADPDRKTYTADIDLQGGRYLCNDSINVTGNQDWGVRFGNGEIYSKATGQIALDFGGSREHWIYNLKIFGDATSTPQVGLFVGRIANLKSSGATVTGITKANPAVVTYTGTNPTNGQSISIKEVVGMTQINYRTFTVANVNTTAKTCELSGLNSTGYSTYVSGGTIYSVSPEGRTSPRHVLAEVRVTGSFDYTAILNYCSEGNHWLNVSAQNDKRDTAAYGIAFMGDDTGLPPVESQFQTAMHGEDSNTFTTSRNVESRRVNETGMTIAAISLTGTNPVVITYTGTDPANGDEIVFSAVGGTVQLNNNTYTITNLNTSAKTFELASTNSSLFSAFTGGSRIEFKTGPAIYMRTLSAQEHVGIYTVTTGSYSYVIEDDGSVGPLSDDIRDLRIKGHNEGNGILGLVLFKTGSRPLKIRKFEFFEHNAHTPKNVFATDANSGGGVTFSDGKIEIVSFQDTPAAFFDSPSLYGFSGASELWIGESAALNSTDIIKLLHLPSKIVVSDAANPVRLYQNQVSPGHLQLLEGGQRLFSSLSSSVALAYNNGWLDRVGSSVGPALSPIEAAAGGGVRLSTSGGLGFSAFGAHRRSSKIYQPDKGDCMLDCVGMMSNPNSRRNVIGFSSVASTSALAATDMPCTLAANGTPTFTDNVLNTEFLGIVYDDALTNKTWRAVARKAAGTPQQADTTISAVGGIPRYWSIRIDMNGNGYIFGSDDNFTWSLLATIANAVTPSVPLCAMFAAQLTAGTAARAYDLYRADVRVAV